MEDAFDKQFSLNEKMQSWISSNGAPMGINAHWDARQTLSCIAKMVDEGIERALIQTDDNQQAIIVDVIRYNDTLIFKRNDEHQLPLILARVAYHNLSKENVLDKESVRMNCALAVKDTMPQSGRIQSTKAGCHEEMTVLNTFFKKNSRLLSKEFVKKLEKNLAMKYFQVPQVFTTFVSPLYTGKFDAVCSFCNSYGEQKLCARCKLTRYCSEKCQRKDWKKQHSLQCYDPSHLKIGECCFVEIDPAKYPEGKEFASTISNVNSFGSFSADSSKCITEVRRVFDNFPVGELLVLKVQIQIGAKVSDPTDICLYPKGKAFVVYGEAQMFTRGAVGFRSLFELVQQNGNDCGFGVGGVKLFLYGVVTEEKKLRVITDKVLPYQPW